jgi:hypothetical protein
VFDGWEAVVPDDAPEAQKRGNYASWADHRTYMEKTYADTFGFVLDELLKIDLEVEAIREFVAKGGTLLADALPGIMDEHCTFRAVRPLQDVFGVSAAPGTRDALIQGAGDPGIQAAGAKALAQDGDRPLLLSNRFGQGRAYLLNRFLFDYPSERDQGRAGPLLDRMGLVLKDAGLRSKVTVSGAGGERVAECAGYLFNLGTTRLLGLVPDKSLPGERRISIRFDGQGAVYDVRQKMLVGTGDRFETSIEPAVPRLFAIVGKPVQGVEVAAPAAAKRGDEIQVGFAALADTAFRSVVKVEALNPAGKSVSHYGRNEDIIDRRRTFRFRTALNDPEGSWRIVITEVLSGRRATAEVKVQ